VTRAAATLVALAATVAPASAAYPAHVPVSLTRIPGNICCPKFTRASVSVHGVLTRATMVRGGTWRRVGRRHLTAAELRPLRTALRRFNPASLEQSPSAGCGGAPVGDVGAYDLKVGTHESNCPPPAAQRLIKLLSGWLPKS
jgi:hypothetical protein